MAEHEPNARASTGDTGSAGENPIPTSPKPATRRKGPLLTWGLIALALAALFVVNLVQMSEPEPEIRPARSTPSILSPETLEAQARQRAARAEQERQWLLDQQAEQRRRQAAQERPKPVPSASRSARPRVEAPQGVAMPSGLLPAGVPAPRPPAPRSAPWATATTARPSTAWAEVEAPPRRGPILRAGTFVPAQLLTPVSSEASGERTVLAMVSHDVRDATQRHVMIPVGSRLLGRLVGDIQPGRARAVIAWDRLDLPDGRIFDLGGAPTTAADGSAGVPGEVDHHWRALYGHAFLTSVLGGLATVSQRGDRVIASTGELFTEGLGRELGRVTERVADRVLDRPSTVELPRGQRVAILVTRDVTFGGAS